MVAASILDAVQPPGRHREIFIYERAYARTVMIVNLALSTSFQPSTIYSRTTRWKLISKLGDRRFVARAILEFIGLIHARSHIICHEAAAAMRLPLLLMAPISIDAIDISGRCLSRIHHACRCRRRNGRHCRTGGARHETKRRCIGSNLLPPLDEAAALKLPVQCRCEIIEIVAKAISRECLMMLHRISCRAGGANARVRRMQLAGKVKLIWRCSPMR